MAAHPGENGGSVMFISPTATLAPHIAITSGESLNPSLASKAGISFVIPKNKLSGALVPVIRTVQRKWYTKEAKTEEEFLPPRRTKWGFDLTEDPVVKRGRALALQTRAEQIAAQLESGHLDIDTDGSTRSPSPPPIYDSNGQRTNTREGRRREHLELERREAIGECLQINPSYKSPVGYKPVFKEAKIYIPVKDYPGYNFIGLILGPRGNTQKRMEAETGSKIAIRGKGAVKEGKKSNVAHAQGGRRDGKEVEGAFEDLHVHIIADCVDKVDATVALIEPLLTPVDEDRNTHKRKQLRELAEMNGTMRDFPKACSLCGEYGNREWHCLKDKLCTFQAKVCCQNCGDESHPTRDCPTKQSGQGKVLDMEYLNFLEELGDALDPGFTSACPTKCVVKENVKEDARVITSTLPSTILDTSEISKTSLDQNQLANVLSGPKPMLIPSTRAQPIPPPWTREDAFPSGFQESLGPQQGNLVQVDGDQNFGSQADESSMQPPGTSGLNSYPNPFTNPGCPSSFGSPHDFQGRIPPSMIDFLQGPPKNPMSSTRLYGQDNIQPPRDLNTFEIQEGTPSLAPFQMPANKGSSSLGTSLCIPISPFIGTTQMETKHSSNPLLLQNPQATGVPSKGPLSIPNGHPFGPPWASLPPLACDMTHWSQKAISRLTNVGNLPMVWKNGSFPQPSWENRTPPIRFPTVWQEPSCPTWDRGTSSRPSPISGQSSSLGWEMQQNPWEATATQYPPFVPQPSIPTPNISHQPSTTMDHLHSLRNPFHPMLSSPPLISPSKVSQSHNFIQHPLDKFPNSKCRSPIWSPHLSSPLLVPIPMSNPPPPHGTPSLATPSTDQSSLPPWHSQTQQSRLGNFESLEGPNLAKINGNSCHPPFPVAHRGQHEVDPRTLDPYPPPSTLPQMERGENQPNIHNSFAPALPTNIQKPVAAMPTHGMILPTEYNTLPLATDEMKQFVSDIPSWKIAELKGQSLGSTPPIPSFRQDKQEVDVEYKKLMASVGIT